VEHVFQQHETLRLGRENTEPNAQITKLIRPPKVCVQNTLLAFLKKCTNLLKNKKRGPLYLR